MDSIEYYKIICKYNKKYLAGRPLATITSIDNITLIKRASKNGVLFADEVEKNVDDNFMFVRKNNLKLNTAKTYLTEKQKQIWNYFVPRKIVRLHYSTNGEQRGNISRVFYDIDAPREMLGEALSTAKELCAVIRSDYELKEIITSQPIIVYTGGSLHVYYDVYPQPPEFYDYYVSTTNTYSRAYEWMSRLKVSGAHKRRNTIIVDGSQTVAGKLARVPLGSIHVNKKGEEDGVSVPFSKTDQLSLKDLRDWSKERVLKEIKTLSRQI